MLTDSFTFVIRIQLCSHLDIFCIFEIPMKDDRFEGSLTDLQEQDEVEHRCCLICFVLAHKPHDRVPGLVSILIPVIPFSFPPEVGSHIVLVIMFAAVWLAGTPALKIP